MEKQISSETVYDGKIIHVHKDMVELDDGRNAYREVVVHNGGVCIALKNEGKYYLVKQYRYSLGKEMWEFPAGKIEKGEDPDEAILREAIEETGYSVKGLRNFAFVIPTCGYCTEKIYLYYGEADKHPGQHFDEDENISLYQFTFAQIEEMIRNHDIDDAKTIALMYQLKLQGIEA